MASRSLLFNRRIFNFSALSALLFCILFWLNITIGFGAAQLSIHPAGKPALYLLTLFSSLFCAYRSILRIANPKEMTWLLPYIMLALSVLTLLTLLVITFLFQQVFW